MPTKLPTKRCRTCQLPRMPHTGLAKVANAPLSSCRWLGVDKVFLTENDKEPTLKAGLRPYIQSKFVDYRRVLRKNSQIDVYNDCINDHGKEYSWMAFLDADEYIILREQHAALLLCSSSFPAVLLLCSSTSQLACMFTHASMLSPNAT